MISRHIARGGCNRRLLVIGRLAGIVCSVLAASSLAACIAHAETTVLRGSTPTPPAEPAPVVVQPVIVPPPQSVCPVGMAYANGYCYYLINRPIEGR